MIWFVYVLWGKDGCDSELLSEGLAQHLLDSVLVCILSSTNRILEDIFINVTHSFDQMLICCVDT